MTFELNYLRNHGSQILHQLLLRLFSKMLRALQLFSARLLVAHGQERDRVKELSYDYESDE